LKSDWQKHALASSGYLELGMLDDAALALEEIQPNDKTRTEVLGARVNLYMAARKWDMAAAVASHLVKVERDLVGQSGLFSSTVRACIKGGSHSVSGASDRTQSCHVRRSKHTAETRREYRRRCETARKSGKQIERGVIASFQIAESMGFNGEFRQWEDLLRIANNGLFRAGKSCKRKLEGRAGFACPVLATADCLPPASRLTVIRDEEQTEPMDEKSLSIDYLFRVRDDFRHDLAT
jgi:hypothetical protein